MIFFLLFYNKKCFNKNFKKELHLRLKTLQKPPIYSKFRLYMFITKLIYACFSMTNIWIRLSKNVVQ